MTDFSQLLRRPWLTVLLFSVGLFAVTVGGYAVWLLAFAGRFDAFTLAVFITFLALLLLVWLLAREGLHGNTLKVATRYAKRDEAQRQTGMSQALYEYYFREAPVGILVCDTQGAIETSNPIVRRLLGRSEIAGGVEHLFLGKDRAGVHKLLLDAQQNPTYQMLEAQLATADEKNVAVYAGFVETYDSSKRLVLHIVDISERKNLEQQILQSQKLQAVGQLAGGIAHDFNNLLTAIIGFCDLLLQRHIPGDPSFADINQIAQNANRAANLVRQLLAFSRQQKLMPKLINITDALAELTHLLRRLLGEAVHLDVQHSRDLWLTKVDQTQLEQVIINLCVNARDAMPEGGKLFVMSENYTAASPQRLGNNDVMPAGDYVLVRVTDTGTGIPPDVLPRIFEPFFTTKGVGAGTGLGLATVHGIIKQTGGFIGVDSVSGRGTTFLVYLPRAVGEEIAVETRAVQPTDLTGTGSILLVEDEDPVRMFAARALRNKGYTVTEMRSGDAAMDYLAKPHAAFQLLVTDVMMPGTDGPTLIRHVRGIYPGMKVVCMSGYAEENLRAKLDSQENIEFLPKPFTLKQLAITVKKVLEE